MEVKETEHFWIIKHDNDNMIHFYDKKQFTQTQAVFYELYAQKIAMALSYALTQEKDTTTKRLIAQEFWHSLNRKGVIPNGMVEILIDCTV